MNRRAFITLLGGAAAATWAPAARAQGDRVRRVAVLALAALNATGRVAVLREELQKLGWREGRNLRLDVRIADDLAALEVAAEEVVKSAPEVIFAFTGPVTRAVQARTRTIPIVFDGGADPIETGLVKNVARPEGNTTGFANSFTTLGGKWVELLKETAPQVTRVAILFNPARSPGDLEWLCLCRLHHRCLRPPHRRLACVPLGTHGLRARCTGAGPPHAMTKHIATATYRDTWGGELQAFLRPQRTTRRAAWGLATASLWRSASC